MIGPEGSTKSTVAVFESTVNFKTAVRLSLRPAAIFLLSRVGILCLFAVTAKSARKPLMSILTGWDSKWYLTVAQYGYVHSVPPGSGSPAQSDLGFFPLLPLLVRGVREVTRLGFNSAGILTSLLLGLGASIAVWWMLRDVVGQAGADRGTALVFLSPAAFVLSMVYSEGAIILFVALSLLALRRHKWIVAGLCAAVASAADPVGCAAAIPCVVTAVLAIRTRREWRALLAPLLAPLGVGSFFVYLWIHTGSPLTWFHAQRMGWQRGRYGSQIYLSVRNFMGHGFAHLDGAVRVVSFAVVIGLLIMFFRAHPPAPWVGYVVTVLILGALSPIIGITPRLLLRGFPLLGVTGARLPPVWFEIVLSFSIMLLATLTFAAGMQLWTP